MTRPTRKLRIAISGTYSTGKTTTTEALSLWVGLPRTHAQTMREILPEVLPGKALEDCSFPELFQLGIVRFTERLLAESVETHVIEGVPVKVFGVVKTIADCFRYRNKIGLSVAIEGLQEALRQRKAMPTEIARQAERGGISTVIRPYLEALTANG